MAISNNRVAVLSFYTEGFQVLQDITGPVKDEYCQRHGYRHLVKIAPYGNPDNYYAFQRLRYIRDLFFGDLPEGEGLEAIMCINTHAQIMNHNVEIQSFFDNEHDFYIHADANGLNAGVFLIKKSDWTKLWLDFLLSKEEIHKHHCWCEQKLMQDFWDLPEFKGKIRVPEHPGFNSYRHDWYNSNPNRLSLEYKEKDGHFIKGNFVLHAPGLCFFKRTNHRSPEERLLESRKALFQSEELLRDIVR